MEHHFQYVAQNVIHDNNSDSFADNFDKYFTQKLGPQKCCDIMSFKIISTVNPIGLMKTCSKPSFTLYMK